MGVKKAFSRDPLDFKKIRKQDVHDPKSAFFKKSSKQFSIANSTITEVNPELPAKKFVLFVHGGAFVSGPARHHWDVIRKISEESSDMVWICNYPKAPESDIREISKNIGEVYKRALEKFSDHEITLIGDSVGGTLIAALTQRLIQHQEKLPKRLIIVSPVMDATMANQAIDPIDSIDPMLSKKGILSAKKMCAVDMDLSNTMISPLNGSFEGFPSTMIFLASHDITYPDQKLAVAKMKKAKVDVEVIEGENMPHIWPFLPVMKEAKLAFQEILNRL
jgi:acetyl esterase/lipase